VSSNAAVISITVYCCRCRYVQHIEKVLQHKDLETQLLEAKLSQASVQLAEEKERNLQEKQQVLNRS